MVCVWGEWSPQHEELLWRVEPRKVENLALDSDTSTRVGWGRICYKAPSPRWRNKSKVYISKVRVIGGCLQIACSSLGKPGGYHIMVNCSANGSALEVVAII